MSETELTMEPSEKHLFKHKGSYFIPELVTPDKIDSLEDFEIRDSDVFAVTYPKSGTVWTQHILSLIYHEGHRDGTENIQTVKRVPWLEYKRHNMDHVFHPSPCLFVTHLPYYLVPRDLRSRRAKVVVGGSWFNHIRGWYTHRDDFNILFLTYEEMKDLRDTVLKICKFLEKKLNEKELDTVVEKATINNMKTDARANYNFLLESHQEGGKGRFLRKGTVGDWKNTMTVAQNERFDGIFKEKMKDLPFKFLWDINEDI